MGIIRTYLLISLTATVPGAVPLMILDTSNYYNRLADPHYNRLADPQSIMMFLVTSTYYNIAMYPDKRMPDGWPVVLIFFR